MNYSYKRMQRAKWFERNRNNIIYAYFNYVPFVLLFYMSLPLASATIALIVVHEFGHYVVARIGGYYKGCGFFPLPHIVITGDGIDHINAFVLPMGIVFSFLVYPIFMSIGISFSDFYLLTIGAGVIDLYMLMKYFKK